MANRLANLDLTKPGAKAYLNLQRNPVTYHVRGGSKYTDLRLSQPAAMFVADRRCRDQSYTLAITVNYRRVSYNAYLVPGELTSVNELLLQEKANRPPCTVLRDRGADILLHQSDLDCSSVKYTLHSIEFHYYKGFRKISLAQSGRIVIGFHYHNEADGDNDLMFQVIEAKELKYYRGYDPTEPIPIRLPLPLHLPLPMETSSSSSYETADEGEGEEDYFPAYESVERVHPEPIELEQGARLETRYDNNGEAYQVLIM